MIILKANVPVPAYVSRDAKVLEAKEGRLLLKSSSKDRGSFISVGFERVEMYPKKFFIDGQGYSIGHLGNWTIKWGYGTLEKVFDKGKRKGLIVKCGPRYCLMPTGYSRLRMLYLTISKLSESGFGKQLVGRSKWKKYLGYVRGGVFPALVMVEFTPKSLIWNKPTKDLGKAFEVFLVMSHYPLEFAVSSDNYVSFGLFQTTYRTYEGLRKIGKDKGIRMPSYQECTTVGCQTKAAIILTYVNLKALLSWIYKDEKRRVSFEKYWKTLGAEGKEYFMVFLVGLLHNGGLSKGTLGALNEFFSKHPENMGFNKSIELLVRLANSQFQNNPAGTYALSVLRAYKYLKNRRFSNRILF